MFAYDDIGESNKKFFGNIAGGYEHAAWFINEYDQKRKRVVDYETEGLSVYRIVGNLGYGHYPFLTFVYEQPVTPSSSQEEMLEANMTQESGMEKFTWGIRLDPIVNHFLTGDNFAQAILRRAFSIRFKYTRELYFGEAKSLVDAVYIPMDAVVDYENRVISGGKGISEGETLAFKTEFIDYEVSLPLFTYGSSKPAKYDFRIGYYDSKWERLSDSRNVVVDDLPSIFDARYRSRGLLLATGTTDLGLPGLNADGYFKIGLDDSLDSAIEWDRHTGSDVVVKQLEGGLNVWYNLYFSPSREGLFLSLGGGWSMRRMTIDISQSDGTDGSSSTVFNDTDELSKLWALLAYRF